MFIHMPHVAMKVLYAPATGQEAAEKEDAGVAAAHASAHAVPCQVGR